MQCGQVVVDDASAHGLSSALALSTGTVAGLPLLQKEAHSAVGHDSLHHGESLLVVSTGDFKNVSLKMKTLELIIRLENEL